MYVLATTQMVVDCVVIFGAFVEPEPRTLRKAKMANNTIPIIATKRALFFVMMILGDIIVIYRCWVVWSHNVLVIILPSCCCFTSAVLAFITIYATQHLEADFAISIVQQPWVYGSALFALSLVANGMATSLIAFRIWQSEKHLRKMHISRLALTWRSNDQTPRRKTLLPIALILIESGALNTAYLITYIITLYVEKDAGGLPIVADMATPLVGIIFSLVIVRVEMNRLRANRMGTIQRSGVGNDHVEGAERRSLTFGAPEQHDTLRGFGHGGTEEIYPMHQTSTNQQWKLREHMPDVPPAPYDTQPDT
ncbi:hypothetical protein E1B28_006594 [Marasmius oreades]|nr:uncharacterized protein E1B28_006594 [Marasmius oreades]KAG7095908.1 hypothetical protein E1B28_006594 [Marasmius oreades]